MQIIALFLSGLLAGNGIPHFVHGISGEEFHDPGLRKLLPGIPSPLFNVLWGLLNFAAAYGLSAAGGGFPGGGPGTAAFLSGFASASIGLSLYFRGRSRKARKQP